MLLVTSLLRWWYGDGWRQRAQLVANRLDGTIDYFSAGLLIKTLFAPFRQISAGTVDGPIGDQMRAMVDKLFSRLVGAVVRLMLLVIGGVAIGLQVILGLVTLAGWAFVPLLPIIGIVLMLTGWTP
jgi:hypothetical protein